MMLFVGFLIFEIVRRDWRAVRIMLVMSLGFAIPFAVGGYWHTMHGSELRIDWWKNWEMTIGLGGGLAFGLAFYLFNQPESANAPRTVTRLERIFGIGLTLWLTVGIVILGAYEGFIRVRGLKESLEATRGVAFKMYIAVATMALAIWVYRTMTTKQEILENPKCSPMPMKLLLAILGIIVVAGYVTSIPDEIQLANQVLLTAYSVYIGTTVLLFGWLWNRRPRA